jgi:DnaJ like chaperone protein
MYRQRQEATSSAQMEVQYYAVLGLEEGADFVEIKKAYRKLSMQYHPDKVGHLGDEFKKISEEKMKEINVAYDYFEKKFANKG